MQRFDKRASNVAPTASEGMNEIGAAAQELLEGLLETFDATSQRMTGYPVNLDYDYSALLPFLQYSANNIGDPFHDSNYASNSHKIEREVIYMLSRT